MTGFAPNADKTVRIETGEVFWRVQDHSEGEETHEESHGDDAAHGDMAADAAHGDDAHAEVGHEEAVGMPQFDTSTYANQAIWLAVALVAIYFILSRLALPRIGEVLERRSQTIQRDLDRAAELKEKAEQTEESYQAALAQARANAQEIGNQAKAEAQTKIDEAMARADAELEVQSKASAERIAGMQKEADKTVSEIASGVVGAVVDAIAPAANDEKSVSKALGKLLKG